MIENSQAIQAALTAICLQTDTKIALIGTIIDGLEKTQEELQKLAETIFKNQKNRKDRENHGAV